MKIENLAQLIASNHQDLVIVICLKLKEPLIPPIGFTMKNAKIVQFVIILTGMNKYVRNLTIQDVWATQIIFKILKNANNLVGQLQMMWIFVYNDMMQDHAGKYLVKIVQYVSCEITYDKY